MIEGVYGGLAAREMISVKHADNISIIVLSAVIVSPHPKKCRVVFIPARNYGTEVVHSRVSCHRLPCEGGPIVATHALPDLFFSIIIPLVGIGVIRCGNIYNMWVIGI
jgi:hypothetical protein